MNISFKRATIEDLSDIIKIEERAKGSKLYGTFDDNEEALEYVNDMITYLIKKDDEAIGRVAYKLDGDNAHIYDLVVVPKFQGEGIGRIALNFALNELKDKKVNLFVHPQNNRALMLYLSFGFVIESWKDNFYGDGEPRLIMVKNK